VDEGREEGPQLVFSHLPSEGILAPTAQVLITTSSGKARCPRESKPYHDHSLIDYLQG
jgi:hypothetical protein